MKLKGIKRGKFIELSEETSLEDGTQITLELSHSSHHSREKSDLNQDYNLTNL